MRVALVNPRWSFDGSIYFGCRSPHLPLEFGYARALLETSEHIVRLIDAQLFDVSLSDVTAEVRAFRPDMVVITTAPSYLFWRCAPPEVRVPQEYAHALRDVAPLLVAVGPHGSTTPRPTLHKLGVDIVVMGECEETLLRLANGDREFAGLCASVDGQARVLGGPQAARFVDQAPLRWSDEVIQRHTHQHHRFDVESKGPGAEIEASRGCPYSCTFCAKENFRNRYRKRELGAVLSEVEQLRAQGVEYVYFIDEIFLPNESLLQGLVGLDIKFGVQTRVDLWTPEALELLGKAGCVSAECGVESLTSEGRNELAKRCRMTTEELTARLIEARRHIPFVQANLIAMPQDDHGEVAAWREHMREHGIWANDPVPMFPYPGSPDYRKLWGEPDDNAWERAVDYYLERVRRFSDIQEQAPRPLRQLEMSMCGCP